MSLRLPLPLACPALLALVTERRSLFASVHDAHASSGTAIGVDLDYTHGINEPGVSRAAFMAASTFRLGYKARLAACADHARGRRRLSHVRRSCRSHVLAGVRRRPARLRQDPGARGVRAPGLRPRRRRICGGGRPGATADAGLTLDLTLLPFIDLGVHGGYNGMLKSGDHSAFDTYVLGVHGALVF